MTTRPSLCRPYQAERLTPATEAAFDAVFVEVSKIRDGLVIANERVAAELVESAIQTLQDACGVLLGKAA